MGVEPVNGKRNKSPMLLGTKGQLIKDLSANLSLPFLKASVILINN